MAANTALVTKTLVGQAAQAIERTDRLELRSFLALSNLCEATVILDRLNVIESSNALSQLPLAASLTEAGLLSEFRPAVSRNDLARVIYRLPEEITDRLIISEVHQPPGSSKREGDDLVDDKFVGRTGAVAGFDYEATLDDLSAQLDSMVTFPSMALDRNVKEYILRSNGYLIVAAAK